MSLAAVPSLQLPAELRIPGIDGLSLVPELAELVPGGTLKRGTSASIVGAVGRTSLLLKVLAGPMASGGWSAVIGLPSLGVEAAGELGVPLNHLALIPDPGSGWLDVTAALLDSVDIVALAPPGKVRPTDARRLLARSRQRGSLLIIVDRPGQSRWPETTDVIFAAADCEWAGLRAGHGVLQDCELTVTTSGRRLAGPRRTACVRGQSTLAAL